MKYLTYLAYIVLWEAFIFGGCAYLVFWKGAHGAWFIFAFILSTSAYPPSQWIHGHKQDSKWKKNILK